MSIGVAADARGMYARAEWASKPSKRKTCETLEGHIKPGSTLVHDGDNSHSALIKALGLASEAHPTAETKGLPDWADPMDRINGIHSLMKAFFGAHGGYAREDLQGWVDLFWFIWSDPESRYDKVGKFLEMAVSRKKIIRYRDFYGE